MNNCIGFIYYTKIAMKSPGGFGSNHRSCYSGHKRFYCLIYRTIDTPYGPILNLYEPKVGRRHDLTQYSQRNLEI